MDWYSQKASTFWVQQHNINSKQTREKLRSYIAIPKEIFYTGIAKSIQLTQKMAGKEEHWNKNKEGKQQLNGKPESNHRNNYTVCQ